MQSTTLAYVAGVIDLHGLLRTREVTGSLLPVVQVHWADFAVLEHLAEITGTTAIETRRDYIKAGCTEHCGEKHQHIVSKSGRWSLTGAKATVFLWNVRPFLRIQEERARELIVLGTQANIKPATVQKMSDLGWDVPDFALLSG